MGSLRRLEFSVSETFSWRELRNVHTSEYVSLELTRFL
jgi:predicted component of type VI protein secretion system